MERFWPVITIPVGIGSLAFGFMLTVTDPLLSLALYIFGGFDLGGTVLAMLSESLGGLGA
jgi:hypothetical protein